MTDTQDHLPETRELAELCGLIRNPTWDTGGEVYIEGDPLTKAAALFTPFTDWNDVHRVVEVLVERGLFRKWMTLRALQINYNHDITLYEDDELGLLSPMWDRHFDELLQQDIVTWATAALEVLRATKEDKQ